jgi:hypothetical protein
VKHSNKAEHQLNFRDTVVLARMTGCMDCLVKEAIEIQLHLDNFNREMGFLLSGTQYLAMNIIKLMRKHIKCHEERPANSNMNSDDQIRVSHMVFSGTEHSDYWILPTVPCAVQAGTDSSFLCKYSMPTHHSSHQLLMEAISDTLDTNSTLTQLMVHKDFIVS